MLVRTSEHAIVAEKVRLPARPTRPDSPGSLKPPRRRAPLRTRSTANSCPPLTGTPARSPSTANPASGASCRAITATARLHVLRVRRPLLLIVATLRMRPRVRARRRARVIA